MKTATPSTWLVPALLIALSAVPVIEGGGTAHHRGDGDRDHAGQCSVFRRTCVRDSPHDAVMTSRSDRNRFNMPAALVALALILSSSVVLVSIRVLAAVTNHFV